MAAALLTFPARSAKEIHDSWIRTVGNGLVLNAGIANPAVSKGTDYDIIANGFARELVVGEASCVVQADQAMPDTAAGANLDRWLGIYGVTRRQPAGSIGQITITASLSSGVLIATGTQLTDSQGLRYQVSAGGTFGNQSQVPIAAIDTGSATNHLNADVLTWVATPAYCDSNVVVGIPGGTDGLTLGSDGEANDDETPRSRLLSRLQGAAAAGNWGHVVQLVAQASPYVQGAFCYPGVYGPSTLAFAATASPQVVGPFSGTSKNRDLPTTIVLSTIIPYVLGVLPEHALVQGFTVQNSPTDVAVLLSLPSAPTASPAGPGGGWLDGTPWPSSISGTTPVTVTAVTSTTNITVNATTAPSVGSHIAWVSPTNWQLYTATVLSFSGSSGAYVLTLDTPLVGIANGNHIFPQSVNQAAYVTALLGAFALMGPGELTSNPTYLQRGYRHPTPQLTWPSSLTAVQLRAIENVGTEVLATQWLYRSQTFAPVPAQTAITAATNASPIQITAAGHGLVTGQLIGIQGVQGNTAANGQWVVTFVDANNFTLNGSTGNGAWTSGGTVYTGPAQIVPRNLSFYAA